MPFFAQSPLPNSGEDNHLDLLTSDLALIVGVGFLALLLLAFFAKQSFGKRSKRRISENRAVPDLLEHSAIKKSKRRKRRRSHRPSNPTLGETGGLPPRS